MPVKARTEFELVGAEDAARRIDLIKVAQQNLERTFLAGRITREQYFQTTQKLNTAEQLLGVQLNTTRQQLDSATAATRRISNEQQQAQRVAGAFGQLFGVALPRQLERFIGQSKLIGPLLMSMTGVISLALAGGILIRYGDEIRDAASSLSGFTEVLRAAAKAQVELNTAILLGFRTKEEGQRVLSDINRQVEQLEKQKAAALALQREAGAGARTGPSPGAAEAGKELARVEAELTRLETLRQTVLTNMTALDKQAAEAKTTHAAAARVLKAAIEVLGQPPTLLRPGEKSEAERLAEENAAWEEEARHLEEVAISIRGAQEELDKLDKQSGKTTDAVVEDAGKMAREWDDAVQEMAGALRSFADDPIRYLKNRWKQMLFEMIAQTIMASETLRGIFGSILGIPMGGTAGGGGGHGGLIIKNLLGGFGFASGGGLFGGFAGGLVPGTPMSAGAGLTSGTALAFGASRGVQAPAGAAGSPTEALNRIRELFGQGPLTQNQAIGVGIAGLVGSLLSSSSNRGVRTAGGALTGGALGFAVGGPIGAAVGAIIGGLIGFFRGPNYGKLRDRFIRDKFQPSIDNVIKAYELHQLDYGSAISQLESLREQGLQQLRQLKGDGSRAHTLIDAAIAKVNSIEQQRLVNAGLIAGLPKPEFAGGGFIPGAFSRAVPILAHAGEAVLNPLQQRMVGPERIRQAFAATGSSPPSPAPAGAGHRAQRSFAEGGMVGGEDAGITMNFYGTLIDEEGVKRAVAEMWPEIQKRARRRSGSQGLPAPF